MTADVDVFVVRTGLSGALVANEAVARSGLVEREA
jgi:hypothetical protein